MAEDRVEFDLDSAIEEIDRLLDARRTDEALGYIAALHPADQAALIAELDAERRTPLLPRIPRDALAGILDYLEEEPRRAVVEELEPAVLGPILDEVDRDVAVDILHILPADRARTTLASMARAAEVTPLLAFEDESAGGRATSDFVALNRAWTVEQAIGYLRSYKPSAEQVFYLYVVDDEHRLSGVVSLRQLVVAGPERRIEELMTPEVVSVHPTEDQEEVLRQVRHYNFVALPVVDEGRHLLGVVSVDDLMDVAEEEATEDMYRMAGLDEDETLLRPIARSVAPRMSWLLLNLVTAFAAAGVVNIFEGTIQRAAALAVFMPIIAGQGGNAGIQTITLTVRSLALGEVDVSDALHILRREVIIGLVNGVTIGLILGVLAYLWKDNVGLGVVAGTAMLLNMATAVTVGVLVPLSLRAAKLDPALAAGVIVTTFTDVMGFFFFLGLATLMIERIS
jgi:magnesium transporter